MADTSARHHDITVAHAADNASRKHVFVASIIATLIGIATLQARGLGDLAFAIAALMVAAGFAIGAIAWFTKAPRETSRISAWDIAGALTFIGFGAAIIGT